MRTSRAAVIGTIAAALFSAGAFAQESHQGTINRLDEASGTVAIAEAQTGTTGSAQRRRRKSSNCRTGWCSSAIALQGDNR
jgi:hypothetical protein